MSECLFLGVDGGSVSHMCVVVDESDQVIWESRIGNTHAGCAELVERITEWQKAGYAVWVGAEGRGGYMSPLDRYLLEAGCRYTALQPLQVCRFREMTKFQPDKTDEKDARLLADFMRWQVREGQARECKKAEAYFEALGMLARTLNQMVEHKVGIQNQLVSRVRQAWPELVLGRRYFSKTDGAGFLALLEAYPTPDAVAKAGEKKVRRVLRDACGKGCEALAKALVLEVRKIAGRLPVPALEASLIQTLAGGVRRLMETIHNLEKELKSQLEANPFGAWLIEQPGIGVRTAACFLGEAGDLSRFETEAKLARYAGNGANVSQSGKSGPRHWDGHRYNHRLKRAVFLMAESRARYDTASIRFKNERLKKGIPYWKVIKQLARHLIRFLWKSWGEVVDSLLKTAEVSA